MGQPPSESPAGEASTEQKVAKGVGWIVAWRMVSRNLGLLSTLLLVRLLAPADFGLVALAASLIATIDQLSTLGAADALIRARDPTREMYDTAFTIGLLRALATAAVIVALAFPLGSFFDDPRVAMVMLALGAGTLLSGLENIGTVDFRRQLTFHKEFVMNVWPRLASVVVTIAAAFVLRSYWALVAGMLTNRAIRLLMSYWMSAFRPRLTLRAWRDLIAFSLWTWAQSMQFLVRDRADSFVIGRYLGTRDFGLFSVGMELGRLPSSELVEPMTRALFAGFASHRNDGRDLEAMFLGAIGFSFMVVWPAGIGISMVADPMVRLMLGEQWLAAVPVVQILALGGVATVFVFPGSTLLNVMGRPNLVFYLFSATTALKVGLLLALVPNHGLPGASVALAVVDSIDAVMISIAVLRGLRASASGLLRRLVRPVLAAMVMVAVLWELGMAWTPAAEGGFPAWCADAALRCGIGAISYLATLMLLWLLAGRPDGAERSILGLAKRFAGRMGLRPAGRS